MGSQSTSDLVPFFLAAGNKNNTDIEQFLHHTIDLGVSFKASEKVSEEGMQSGPEVVSYDGMPEAGLSYDQLAQAFSQIASKSRNMGSPNFLGFPDAGNNAAGLAASVLIPLLNQNMANHDISSPEATFIEMEVVHWIRAALGYSVAPTYSTASEIGGVMTLGGCLSNTIALVAARERLFPGSGLRGLPVLPSTVRVLVPNVIEHYSIRSAMAWLSLGEKNVVRVPVDKNFHMDQDALERIISEEQAQGNSILACVAYAGDTRSMRIDHLDSLADILQNHGIWFHVDACHGGQLAFSEAHRSKLRGIEKADSITIDPHKVLFIPYTCSFVLFKDPTAHAATATNSDLILDTQWSLGRITPFIGSKAFDALKLWATIKFFGRQRLAQLIDERLDLTHAIQSEIADRRPDIVLLNTSDINSCMIAFIPEPVQQYCIRNRTRLSDSDLEKLNKLNLAIKEAILQGGAFYIHGFRVKSCPHDDFIDPDKPLYVLRTMNGNPASTIVHVRGLLDAIERLGTQLFAQTEYQFTASDASSNRLHSVEQKLQAGLRGVFGKDPYVAVIYGSSALTNNALLSNVDLMVFAHSTAPTSRSSEIEAMFRAAMREEGVLIDAKVPFHRKLLVDLSLARSAAEAGPTLDGNGHVQSLCKTVEYLESDEMLVRLVFNVLTTPNRVLSSNNIALTTTFHELEETAGRKLVNLIRSINPGEVNTPDDFVRYAGSDGPRSGEEYLGYKTMRSIVSEKLAGTFRRVVGEENKHSSEKRLIRVWHLCLWNGHLSHLLSKIPSLARLWSAFDSSKSPLTLENTSL